MRVRVVKNKVAPPLRTAEFDIMYNEGISKAGDIIDLDSQMDIIQKHGAFFSYGDVRLGQGLENAKDFPPHNPELSAEIEKAVREQALGGALPMFNVPAADEGEKRHSRNKFIGVSA